MAVIVKNSFLDIADEKCVSVRRCHSVPRSWKLMMSENSSDETPETMASPDSSTRALLFSNFSFYSPGTCSDELSNEGEGDAEPTFHLPARSHCRTPSTMSRASTACLGESSSASACDTSSVCSPCELSALELEREEEQFCTQCGLEVEDRTQLNIDAPAFQPVQSETREDAVVNAVHLALKACGHASHIKIEKGPDGRSSTLISAQVHNGSQTYQVLHLAKGALEAITSQLPTVAMLSARVQKEDAGYSLRSSVAYVPKESEDRMCWDLFQRGCCLRRHQCRWYHPESSDIGKIKISIKCAQGITAVSSEGHLPLSSAARKRTISLGDLV